MDGNKNETGLTIFGNYQKWAIGVWQFIILVSSIFVCYFYIIKNTTMTTTTIKSAELWLTLNNTPLLKKSGTIPKKRVQFSSVAQSCPTLCDPMNCSMPGLPVHHQLPEFTQTRPSSRWCHPAISSFVVPFSCPQSLPASESFPMRQLFVWGGQGIGVSALASVLPMNTQDWYPLEWTGWISLRSEGLSKVFSNTTVQKHQFFSAQLSSQSNSHIHTWPQEKP